MPGDSKRITGPETSESPYIYTKKKTVEKEFHGENLDKLSELIKSPRQDARQDDEIRPVFLQAGIISQANGSAYIELSNTKVICAVYGPRESTRFEDFSMVGRLNCEFKFAPFALQQRLQHRRSMQEIDYSTLVQEGLESAVCLHMFPKAQVDVYVKVLEDNGCSLSTAFTAASLALADAGIEMFDIVLGSEVRVVADRYLIDPTDLEEQGIGRAAENSGHSGDTTPLRSENNALITLAFLPSLNQVSAIVQRGQLCRSHAPKAIKMCQSACYQLFPVVQQCISKAVKVKIPQKNMDTATKLN